MGKPVIWTVDDDPDVLRAVERDLDPAAIGAVEDAADGNLPLRGPNLDSAAVKSGEELLRFYDGTPYQCQGPSGHVSGRGGMGRMAKCASHRAQLFCKRLAISLAP